MVSSRSFTTPALLHKLVAEPAGKQLFCGSCPIQCQHVPAQACCGTTTPSPGCQLVLWRLHFRCARVEALYRAHLQQQTHLPLDAAMVHLKLCITVLCVALIWARVVPARPIGSALWLLYLGLLAAQALLMALLPRQYAARREMLLLQLFKPGLALALMGLVPAFVLEPALCLPTFLKDLLLGSGVVALVCTGVLMPVPWHHHLPAALLSLSSVMATLDRALVDVLLCTKTSRGYVAAAYQLLCACMTQLSSLMLPPAALPTPGLRVQAYSILLTVQVALGLLLPGLLLYTHELCSRHKFGAMAAPGAVSPASQLPLMQLQALTRDSALPPSLLLAAGAAVLAAATWNLVAVVAVPASVLLDASPLAWPAAWLLGGSSAAACMAGPIA